MSEETTFQSKTSVLFEEETFQNLQSFLLQSSYSQYFILVDSNTKIDCLPVLASFFEEESLSYTLLEVSAGEASKSLEVASALWEKLSDSRADRKSLLLNLGGGMITDLGGFVAAVYKRGIDFVNLPTSLLGIVDAAVGGKCGIDFGGLKNQLGVFKDSKHCFVYSSFLETLPQKELISGYAEMVKHALIEDDLDWTTIKSFDTMPEDSVIRKAISTKLKIVDNDPLEKGERKKLNFGHTIGHAVESLFLEKGEAIPHGYAVAVGMQCELYISVKMSLMGSHLATNYQQYLLKFFPRVNFLKSEIQTILNYMIHDKKNEGGKTLFTLLNGKGSAIVNQEVEENLVKEALEFYLDYE